MKKSEILKKGSYIPTPVLQIKEYTHGIIISLLFKYIDDYVIPYGQQEPYFNDMEKDAIIPINKEYHEKTYFHLRDVLKPWLIREYKELSSFGYHFSVANALEDILISKGNELLEKGYELRRVNIPIIFRQGARIAFKAKTRIDWFDMKAGLIDKDGKFINICFSDIFISENLVKHKDEYYLITPRDLEKLKNLLLLGLDDNGSFTISKYNSYFFEEYYELIQNKNDKEIAKVKNALDKLKKFSEIKKILQPVHFKGKLRPYQKAGLNWLYFLYKYRMNGCLADDMGLGKTIQTLALLQKLKEESVLGNVLLIVPVSTLSNWEAELSRFTPDLSYIRHHGSERKKDISKYSSFDILLTTYHTFRNDLYIFTKHQFFYVILDEAQYIKNASSQINRSICLISAKHKLSISGTPVENGTIELWAQMKFLMPGLLGTYKDFIEKFAKPIEEKHDKEKAKILKKTVYPFILRRKKSDVDADLPDKEEITLFVEMSDEQKLLYEKVKNLYKNRIIDVIDKKGYSGSKIYVLEALLRLRQAALIPALIDKEHSNIKSGKLELLKEITEELHSEGHKMIIFSQFVGCLSCIKSHFLEKNINFSYLDGSIKDRKGEIKKFQEDKNVGVFLISLKAGGVGINLTEAEYIILFDPWWNPAVEKQAIDRAHRIGQKRKVIVYRLITKNTVEEKICELQKKKMSIADNIITDEKTIFKSLNRKDIISLF